MIDITEYSELIEMINRELNSGNIIEVKREPQGVTIIRIDRKVKYRVGEKPNRA